MRALRLGGEPRDGNGRRTALPRLSWGAHRPPCALGYNRPPTSPCWRL